MFRDFGLQGLEIRVLGLRVLRGSTANPRIQALKRRK